MVLVYGLANLLQSIAAGRTATQRTFAPGLLLRLAHQRTYLLGIGCQALGFVLALLARRDLPLFLVQASITAALVITALLGVLVLGWRLPTAEILLLVLLVAGIAALACAARPAPARPLGPPALVALTLAVVVLGALGPLVVRLPGTPGSVLLGTLAGLAFTAAAVAARPLASADSVPAFLGDPLLYLVLAHSALGQLLLGLALQRGSATSTIAAMDAAGVLPATVIGLYVLSDKIWPGREWLAALGFLVTLGAVLGLTRYGRPQQPPRWWSRQRRAACPTPPGPPQPSVAGWRRRSTRS